MNVNARFFHINDWSIFTKKLYYIYSKDHQKAQLLRHAVAEDRKKQKKNPRLLARMKMNKKRKKKKRKIEKASSDAIGEDETNTADLSFEDL